jgi:hypothetical protein
MSTYIPERLDARGINLGSRIVGSSAVAASPSGATETTVCTVTLPSNLQTFSKVVLIGFAAFTIGTSGDHYTLKIRQTDTSGSTLYSSGTIAASAAALINSGALAFDTAPAAGQVYVLTLTVANGAAASTVSSTGLAAIVV